MQNVFNTVKSKALGVAEYLTPVLKVDLLPKLFIKFYLDILWSRTIFLPDSRFSGAWHCFLSMKTF